MTVPIVLDTNTFRDQNFLNSLTTYHDRKIVPTIVLFEIYMYFRKKGRSIQIIDRMFRKLGIECEDFKIKNAISATEFMAQHGKGGQEENLKDFLIAAHASIAPVHVITFNKKDFWYLEPRVLEPYEFIKRYIG